MARYTDAVCRQCRREKQKLFLKGERCYSEKCSFVRRSYAPGQHGQNRVKVSEYGTQLRAKMTARRYYGVLESQFAKYFEMAERRSGITGENLLRILESRLDNVVYRLGLASSRPEARQLVRHGHFTVNGKKVDVPSYLCKDGEVIGVGNRLKNSAKMTAIIDSKGAPVPQWLDFNKDTLQATVVRMPNRNEIDLEVAEQAIVELYSK